MTIDNASPQSGIQGLILDTVKVFGVDMDGSPGIGVEVNGNTHTDFFFDPLMKQLNITSLNLTMEDEFYINFFYFS